MSIKEAVFRFLVQHPGASAKKMLTSCNHFYKNTPYVEEDLIRSSVYKKLRILKRNGKVQKFRQLLVFNQPKGALMSIFGGDRVEKS